jgi:hypothetical protein
MHTFLYNPLFYLLTELKAFVTIYTESCGCIKSKLKIRVTPFIANR